jgi:outer membrane protein OmpA-like peptidoglycan-associated protein
MGFEWAVSYAGRLFFYVVRWGREMTVRRILGVATLAAAVGLVSGCAAVRNARDRIVKAPSACEDITVQIYFEPDSAEVTREGRAVLSQAAAQARPCRIDRVTVLGLADATGAPGANFELSRRRAAAVTGALAASGLPAAEFDLQAAGQSGAITPAGAQPLRRRADVTVELSVPK